MHQQKVNARKLGGVPLGPVDAGRAYWVRATGIWWDFYIPCTADGYPAPLFYLLGKPPLHEDGVRYMRLWGCITPREAPGPDDMWFRIGSEHQFTAEQSGTLWVAANDRPGFFGNNWGAVTAYLSNAPMPALSTDWMWTRFTQFLARINGIPLIFGLLLLLWMLICRSSQGADLMVTTAEGAHAGSDFLRTFGLFTLMSVFLSFQCWFWSRTIVVRNFGQDPNSWFTPSGKDWRPAWFLVWAPRALGLFSFVIGLWGLWRAEMLWPEHGWPFGWIFGAVGLALFAFYVVRRKLFGWRIGRGAEAGAERDAEKDRAKVAAYGGLVLGWTSVAGALALLVWFSVFPVRFAQGLGPAAVVYLAVGLMIPVLAGLSNVFSATRFPLLLALAAWAMIISSGTDDHAVGRRVTKETVAAPAGNGDSRATLQDAFAAWQAKQPPGDRDTIVLVAAAGGASRAGYWTGLVLSELDDMARRKGLPRFSDRVFAISSVSGGSVGAAGYVADAALDRPLSPDEQTDPAQRRAVSMNDGDFLSPTLAGMLFPDLFSRFAPFPFFPDRAEALELSWERRWQDIAPGSDAFASPFLDLWKGKLGHAPSNAHWTPLLLINGTREEDGRRVITAPIFIRPTDFLDAVDFYQVHPTDIRLSTAVHNGARFPLVSPAGLMSPTGGHIIDGGYFDNAGTETLRDLAQALIKLDPQLRPIIIEINNDDSAWNPSFARTSPRPDGDAKAQAARAQADAEALAGSKQGKPWRWANDILGPLIGVFSVRDSHGTIASVHLARFGPQAGQPQSSFVFAHLYPFEKKQLPVNWVLSGQSMARARTVAGLGDRNDDPCKAREALESVIAGLTPGQALQSPTISDHPACQLPPRQTFVDWFLGRSGAAAQRGA